MTRSTTLQLPQGPIEVHEDGPPDGPPVLCVHGVFVDFTLWDRITPALVEAGLRVVRPTFPLGGHRAPLHPDADLTPPAVGRLIADVVEALDLRDVTLLANDSGGGFTQVALTHPSSRDRLVPRVARLVLTSCDAFTHFPPPLLKPGFVWFGGRVPGATRVLAALFGVHRLERLMFGLTNKKRVPPNLVDGWLTGLRGPRAAAIHRDLRKALRAVDKRYTLDAAERLHAFDRPTLLAWSREDPLFPFAHAERLAAILPDARVAPIEDAYVFSMLDQPDVLSRLIVDFAQDPPSRS